MTVRRASPSAKPVLFETAAVHVAAKVPVVDPSSVVGAIRDSLVGEAFDAATSIAVCEDGRLVGLLRIEDLFSAPEEATAAELMDSDPPGVVPGTDQEAAASTAAHRGESTLAVVEADGGFIGLVPADRLLAVLLAEHEEDMARLGGFLKGASSARLASREPVRRRLWHRLPWLMVGLAGAFAAAGIVGSFESQLKDNVILAFFLPGVVYMADAVGTQPSSCAVFRWGYPSGRW